MTGRTLPTRARTTFPSLAAGVLLALLTAGPTSAQESHLLVVGGLEGTPEMGERFRTWGGRIADAVRERFGLPAGHVTYLAANPDEDPDRIARRSTAENVDAAFDDLAARTDEGDRILVVLLGHGSWDGERSRFSLPGPDLSASDFGDLLERLSGRTVALVNAASASGEFIPALSGPGRIIVTATSTGRERNATEFGRYFSEALAEEGADIDRDGSISLLEAFIYARTEVARHYEEQNLLLTEHALLDDDGDGEGTVEPSDGEGEGSLAGSFVLEPGAEALAGDDPELRELHEERQRLESALRDLRSRSGDLDEGAYQDSLEVLLVDIARTNRRIQEREAERP